VAIILLILHLRRRQYFTKYDEENMTSKNQSKIPHPCLKKAMKKIFVFD